MRPRTIFLHLSDALPRHWTPADANGARRWGLGFGAGLLLFMIVGAFGAYMAIDAEQAEDAWNRPDADRMHRLAAPASDADAPLASSSANLVALLTEQLASANADDQADAARLHRTPPSRRALRERHPAALPGPEAAPKTPSASVEHPIRRPARPAASQTESKSTAAAPSQIESKPTAAAAPGEMESRPPAVAALGQTESKPPAVTALSQTESRPAAAAAPDQTESKPPAATALGPTESKPTSAAATDISTPTVPRTTADTEPPTSAASAGEATKANVPVEAKTTPARKPLATAKHVHVRGPTVHHAGSKRRRHPSHITITRAPNIFFTLPRFLTEPMRAPAAPRPPAASFDLSDNQRELFRGH